MNLAVRRAASDRLRGPFSKARSNRFPRGQDESGLTAQTRSDMSEPEVSVGPTPSEARLLQDFPLGLVIAHTSSSGLTRASLSLKLTARMVTASRQRRCCSGRALALKLRSGQVQSSGSGMGPLIRITVEHLHKLRHQELALPATCL